MPELWDCECKYGTLQSPINLVKSEAKTNFYNIRVEFDFHPIHDYKIKFRDYDVTMQGDYGNVIIYINNEKVVIAITIIKFDFPSLHEFNGKKYDGEITIVGSNEENNFNLILSIPIKSSYGDEVEIKNNKFLQDLKFEEWIVQNEIPFCLSSKPDLNDFVPGGFNKFFTNYYYYVGSYSIPPCIEGTVRLISEKHVLVNWAQIDLVKSRTYQDISRNVSLFFFINKFYFFFNIIYKDSKY